VIHDLVHAELFFRDPAVRLEQLGFYKMIQKTLDTNFFTNHFADPIFQQNLEYLISDMNSVSLHLCMCLKSAMIQSYLRKSGRSEKEFLPKNLKDEFTTHFSDLLNIWSVSRSEKNPFLSLNEPQFCRATDGKIISEFFEKSARC